MSTAALVINCKLALEDISCCDAVKLKMLNTIQENTHMTSSRFTKEKRLLECFSLKTPIAWGKTNDDRWAQLDDIVCSKLTPSQNGNFGHSQQPKRDLFRQSRGSKLSTQLIREKNLLTAQINSIFLPDQQVALEQLLTDTKIKFVLCVSPKNVVDGAG